MGIGTPRLARWTWLLFGVCSLAAVLIGCWSGAAFGVPVSAVALDLAGWLVGAAVAVSVARVPGRWTPVLLILAFAVLLVSLVSAGLSGVHRWFAIGPLRMNAAELVLPIALVACGGLDRASLLRLLFPIVVTIVSAIQPDGSQAVATAAGTAIILITSSRSRLTRILLALASAVAVTMCLLRPDPLAPVPQVEGVVLLAARLSPVAACLGVAFIAGSLTAPLLLLRVRRTPVRDAVLTLATYSTVAALAPIVGAFPVPLMGIAVSPIIGAWMGLGGLMGVAANGESHGA